MSHLGIKQRPPEWLILDGGCLHPSTTHALKSMSYALWGVRSAVSVWSLVNVKDHQLRKYGTLDALANTLLIDINKRLQRADYADGATRFKVGTKATDFELSRVRYALAACPDPLHGVQTCADDWASSPFRLWPEEPETDTIPLDDRNLHGFEVEEKITEDEAAEREDDLRRWRGHGQKWIDAFLPDARKRVHTFLNDNRQTNDEVATRANLAGKQPPTGTKLKFGKVADLKVEQHELRPGARGRLWTWEKGCCSELRYKSLNHKVKFNASNVSKAASKLNFKDHRAIQMITTTGVTHGTVSFPLTSYACRNHQGAAKFPQHVTDMLLDMIAEGNLAENADGSAWSEFPNVLPFGCVPVNGTEQRLKPEQYERWTSGDSWKPNVRGTFDGSSPHDGTSPNDFCTLLPEENLEWVTVTQVVHGLRILKSIRVEVKYFKLDLRRAYFQLFQQITTTWRQLVFWKYKVGDTMMGGFVRSLRLMWGMKIGGSIFHRAVTTLTVKWIIRCLLLEWIPTIQCPTTREWIQKRLREFQDPKASKDNQEPAQSGSHAQHQIPGAHEPRTQQAAPFMVNGFLDDFFIFVAGTDADIARAHAVVMSAFQFLGWEISQSKYKTEGTPAFDGVILGHGINTKDEVRYVTPTKIDRIKREADALLSTNMWNEDPLSSFVGLLQSVRGDVTSRWRLGPLYRVLHSTNETLKKASPRAKECIKKVLRSIHERKSIFHVPVPWVLPSHPLQIGIPNSDAAQQHGFCGVLRTTNGLEFYTKSWSERTKSARVHIAVLEAYAVVVTAAVWADKCRGQKVVFRSDSAEACTFLNNLNSRSSAMERVIDLWEDLQFELQMQALVVHVAGKENGVADVGSRQPDGTVKINLKRRMAALHLSAEVFTRIDIPSVVGTLQIEIEDEILRRHLLPGKAKLATEDWKIVTGKRKRGCQ